MPVAAPRTCMCPTGNRRRSHQRPSPGPPPPMFHGNRRFNGNAASNHAALRSASAAAEHGYGCFTLLDNAWLVG